MPVRKFRSVEEMNQPIWYTPGDPALYRAIAVTWDLARRAHPGRFSPGVRRFTSVDEMHRIQDEAESEYVKNLQARRRR